MKKFIAFILILFAFAATAVCQGLTPISEASSPPGFSALFYSFSAIVAFIPFVMEFIKKIVAIKQGIVTQVISWIIGTVICFLGWYAHLGIFYGLTWYQVLIISIAIGLAANGFYKTDAVTGILRGLKIIKQ